jgi:hypothetical protein
VPEGLLAMTSGPPPASRIGVASVNPLDLTLVVGGVVALIFSFFEYYTVELTQRFQTQLCDNDPIPASAKAICSGTSASAWHGLFGWFGAVLLLVAAVFVVVQVFAPHTMSPHAPTRLITLVLCGAGLLCTVIALFVIPHGDAGDALQGSDLTLDDVFDFGHGFSYWLILVVAAAMTAIAALRLAQTGRASRAVGPPTAGYVQQPPEYPPAGYGQQLRPDQSYSDPIYPAPGQPPEQQ